jgi:hypothetical protein
VQVVGHGAAHVAEADECDFHGVLLLDVVVMVKGNGDGFSMNLIARNAYP